MYTLFKTRHKI